MKKLVRSFLRDEDGATAIEYSLIAVLLAGTLVAIWPLFYGDFMATWTNVGKTISSAVK
jgi:Flp pilus assembly pilin Flp